MSVPLGLARLHPSAAAARPHYLGFSTARTVADDSLFELWNDSTSAARVLRVNKDGQIQAANGTVLLPAYSFEADKDCGLYRIGANNIGVAVNAAKVLDIGTGGLGVTGTLTATGTAYIGDTSNANVTLGLTINQGPADDHLLAGKSSDVAHGLTSVAEADTYVAIFKAAAAAGGLVVDSIMENSADTVAMQFRSFGGTANTTKSTAGRSLVEFVVYEHNGSNTLDNITADGNIFGIRCYVGGADVTRWLVDEDGDTWQAGGATFGGVDGLDVNPGSDVDADLVTVGVTGAPRLYWLESGDRFYFTKGITSDGSLVLGGGLVLGGPTGGDKGVGTLNAQNDIYKNNTAYTNPDYVFEAEYTGAAFDEKFAAYRVPALTAVEAFTREHLHLPGISRHASGIFERADMLLEKIEEIHLFLFEHQRRLAALEAQ